jgi:uncharacterized protein with PIN domain
VPQAVQPRRPEGRPVWREAEGVDGQGPSAQLQGAKRAQVVTRPRWRRQYPVSDHETTMHVWRAGCCARHPSRLRTVRSWPYGADMTSDIGTAIIAAVSALGGVSLGALLSRRNEKTAQAERLLVNAINDAVTAIAEVAQTKSQEAQARYGSALSRIALYASPTVVTAFRRFQDEANTTTIEGRSLLIDAVLVARHELGENDIDRDDLHVLLFGSKDCVGPQL